MFKGLTGLADLPKMMKAAQELQGKMAELQEAMARITVTGSAGAGLVTVRATAKGDLTGIDIDRSILIASEKEVIEDLILAAVKDAQSRAAERSQQELARLTEGLGLPAGMKLPF